MVTKMKQGFGGKVPKKFDTNLLCPIGGENIPINNN